MLNFDQADDEIIYIWCMKQVIYNLSVVKITGRMMFLNSKIYQELWISLGRVYHFNNLPHNSQTKCIYTVVQYVLERLKMGGRGLRLHLTSCLKTDTETLQS